ncbi:MULTISPECIES: phosphodiester glycosidase family protein [Niastella]|uniref:Phosphodiester glycosidase family protein n=1 Tax=Niastella soli TaxID=2821487 RepID=A0ABS3YWS5_9BACT|nr:phosphodiester glycosidase family protein [Niastella soli]MBO9202381.1 phosphodiester glycosidase family protein [Niastella soli]
MKGLFLFTGLLLTGILVQAQSDSLRVVNAKWANKKLAKGVIWKSTRVENNELFNANQYINVIEVSPNNRRVKLHIVHSDSLEKTSQLAQNVHALAAINGSFFKMRGADPDYRPDLKGVPKLEPSKLDHNRSVVYLRENDSLIAPNIPGKEPVRKRNNQGSIAINGSDFFIVAGDSLNLQSENYIKAHDVISTGPLMILNGVDLPISNDKFCNDRHPRTAMGEKADGTIVFLVVDGRAKEAAGFSIPELQKLMKWLGCRDAINLDGGGSTSMYVKGQPYYGVVNYPSDNKKWDHEGEREVANVIVIKQ